MQIPKLSKLGTKRRKILTKEVSSSKYIPYYCHFTENTVITKNGELMACLRIPGFSFETADDEDLDSKKNIRNNLFKGLSSGKFAVYITTIRRKQSGYPRGEFASFFCGELDRRWKMQHGKDFTFINEHYMTIIRKKTLSDSLGKLVNKFKGEDEEGGYDQRRELSDMHLELEEVMDRVKNAFSSYNAEILTTKQTSSGCVSEILEFFGMIVNCCEYQKMLVPTSDCSKYINNVRHFFGSNYLEVQGHNSTKYASMISLKEYRSSTQAGLLDSFLQLPFELIITQSFSFIDKMIAINKLQLQQRRLMQSEDVAHSQVAEISMALDDAMSGRYGFGNHHLTVMCFAESKKYLDSVVSQVVVEFTNNGINAVRERLNMEACFWGQLPGNFDYLVRRSIIHTLNLSGYASFHNYPPGKADGNHWGPAVTVFNTTSGTPYFFNFHVRDVGHTMIIGPTGAGKTVLMNFLCAQAQKFKPKMFFFDKDHGAEIFIRAIGGRYTKPDASVNSGFNPFQLPDTNNNKKFLIELISALVTTNQEVLTAEEILVIQQAVDGCYKLPKKQRTAHNVAAFLGMNIPGSLASRFAQWHGDGSRAKLFDNEIDAIDFDSASAFGFEMGEILQDKMALAPVLLYLFHRISDSLDGRPTMVILDEAWALIDNPVFGPKIKDWLKVMRKLNAMVVFATQSVEDATKSDISDTLVQQTATQIFLPNLKATEVYRKVFMLSAREFAIVKNTDPSSRFFLVKQDHNAVVTRVDLRGMDDIIHILSGRADTVELLHRIIEERGKNPEQWIYYFLQAIEAIEQAKSKDVADEYKDQEVADEEG